MLRWLVVFTAFLVFLGVWASAVFAQTPSPAPAPTPSSSGAYASLSPGNQKIARALFEAQKTGSGGTTAPLTLDDIAAKKQGGQGGWGKIFKDMKAQGLVQEKNLGQVVSRQHRAGNGHVGTDKHRDGEQEGKYEHSSSGRGNAYASGSGRSEAGRAEGAGGHGGRGGK